MEFQPKWIAWEITRRCNLHCIHCRSSSDFESKGHPDIPKTDAFRFLDDISNYAKPVLVLSGGEPLIREDVFEIAQYGSKKGLRMCLATNGSLVTDEICKEILRSDIKMVSMSLDGSNSEIHDNFRDQKGSFDAVIKAIELFKKHKIDFLINSSFSNRNKHDIENVYKLVKSLGATAWYLFMVVPTGRAEEIINELIPKDEYEAILNWHYEMEKSEKELLVRPTCAPHYYRIILQRSKRDSETFQKRTLKFSTGGAKGCIAGQLICFINVDGDVYPCSYFPKPAGNLYKETFKSIWEGSELFIQLRDFKKYKGKCGKCQYLKVCGGCRARAYAINGDYLSEEPFCSYIPERSSKHLIKQG
ncbi:MAG: radical SAM protein [Thermodesulfovibrionales bacterium]|nr:radical SAM protein [Thermodesulfovibrionales bacterium]